MALRYLFDEHLRGTLPQVVIRSARRQVFVINVVQVGDVPDVPLGSSDPQLLRWAEINDRILISHDSATLPTHLAEHMASGRHSPGVFIVRSPFNATLADWLVLIAFASEPDEWRDCVTFVP